MSRRVCVILTARGNYAKLKTVISGIEAHPDLELQLVIGGSLVLEKYGRILNDKETENYQPSCSIHFVIEGETPLTMAKSAGLAVTEFANAFENLKPDVVLVMADRYECLAITMAATYMNIPVAHIEGGEISGSIDESIRHAVTKMAHIHFPASLEASDRIVRMGEDRSTVFHVGATSIDALLEIDLDNLDPVIEFQSLHGVGRKVHLEPGNYVLVIHHPVTTEYVENYKHTIQTALGIRELGFPAIWVWPNMDAGSDGISKAIREFRESGEADNVYFFKSLPIEVFGPLLKNAGCIIGNSSCGLREALFLGTPSVNIGNRQQGRYRGANVVDVGYNSEEIAKAALKQCHRGPYEREYNYGGGGAAKKIVDVLAIQPIQQQKRNTY